MARFEAVRLCDAGYFSFMLAVAASGQPAKKQVRPPPRWPQRATIHPEELGPGDAVAVLTGVRNDLFVVGGFRRRQDAC